MYLLCLEACQPSWVIECQSNNTITKAISVKVNVIVRLEIELAYNDVAVPRETMQCGSP